MRKLITVAKTLASQGKTFDANTLLQAARFVVPVSPESERQLVELSTRLLGERMVFASGSSSAAKKLFASGQSIVEKFPFSDAVRDFVIQAGGLDSMHTRLLEDAAAPLDASHQSPSTPQTVTSSASEFLPSILGQPEALASLRHALARMPAAGANAPRAAFFLVGPPASGKTLIASQLAAALQARGGEAWHTLHVDMARFRDEDEGFGLTGLRKGWGNAREGLITGFIKKHPRTVVVIDNLDQGHPRAQEALLPVFDSGTLRDDFLEEDVDCRQTVWVFASNLARRLFALPDFLTRMQQDGQAAEQLVLQELAQAVTVREGVLLPALAPGLLSRLALSNLVLLRPLGWDDLLAIARQAVDRQQADWAHSLGVTLAPLPDAVLHAVLLTLAPQVDARRATNGVPRWLVHAMQRALDTPGGKQPPQSLALALSPALAEALPAYASDAGLRQLLRSGRSLPLQVVPSQKAGQLTLTLEGGEPVKVASVGDFQGAGGIRVTVPEVGFDRIHGHERVKTRLREVATLLGRPEAPLSRGMLLHGKPGTGKTMLAKAFSHEADKPFIALTGPQLFDQDLVRQVFQRARDYAPCIVFIDEIDALGRRDLGGYVQHINLLLAEIDGFDSAAGVFVIAATNFPERIDPALLRAGRLDLHVEVPALDREARGFFIDRILKDLGLKRGKTQRERLIDYSSGMTGAELERVRREAALLQQREPGQDTEPDKMARLEEAISIVKHGESNVSRRKDNREHIAYHEAGHAVCSAVLNPEVNIEQVTIVPRGGSLGFVAYSQDETSRRYTVTEVREAVAVMLAGRATERLWAEMRNNGDNTAHEEGVEAGAEDDLRRATALCYRAIAHWGMEPALGAINLDGLPEDMRPHLAEQVMLHVRAWLESISGCTENVLRQNWGAVEKLAKRLLADETVDGKAAKKLVRETSPNPSPCELPLNA